MDRNYSVLGDTDTATEDVPRKGNVDRNAIYADFRPYIVRDVPRKGNVDRNMESKWKPSLIVDVPRKGNVDRNDIDEFRKSDSQ